VIGDAIELRDVRGPSALGGGWRRSLELLFLIASMEFKRTYFGTVLGYLWSLVRPLLLFAVLLAVFTHLTRLSNVHDYPVLLLTGIVLFGFFQEATSAAVDSVVNQEAIVRKTQFPRLVIPMAVVLTSCFNLGPNLVVMFAFVLAWGVPPMWTWLLVPLLLLVLFVFTAAVSLLLSSLYPRYRDVRIIWAVVVTALFYATPVLYPLNRLHGAIATLVACNPLTPMLELARRWIIDPTAPIRTEPAAVVIVPIVLYVGICVIGVWVFNREAPRIAEEL
jgi:ABC-2 type transport system permease protein